MKLGSNLDLGKLELQNARVQNLGSAPSSPVEGQIWYDTTGGVKTIKQWNGTAWIPMDASKMAAGSIPLSVLATDPLARANHTGTQLASTISDFNTAVRLNRIDQLAAAGADVSMGGFKITGLATPVSGSDAATKDYADAASAGIDSKASVRAATTANITLSGTQTIDGVSVVAGNRVLVKNQTTGSQNGIYVVAAGAWSRSSDCNSATNYTPQAFVFVEEGTTLGGTQWKVSTTGTFVIDTTSITWSQFGAAGSYTASTGLTLVGNDFRVNAGNGIIADGTSTRVDPAVVVRKFAQTIGDGSTTSFTITHNLNTTDIQVVVRLVSTGEQVLVDNIAATVNTATVTFSVAPATNTYRVIVQG